LISLSYHTRTSFLTRTGLRKALFQPVRGKCEFLPRTFLEPLILCQEPQEPKSFPIAGAGTLGQGAAAVALGPLDLAQP